MKVNFNKETKSIVIDDAAGQNTLLLNLLFGCNALVAILHFFSNGFHYMLVIDYFFVFLLISSIVALVYFNLHRTNSKEIPIDQIEKLKSSTDFNRIIYDIVLKNGKIRRLNFGDDFKSIEQLKLLLDEKQV
jgi:hypothetical protein